MKHGRANPIKLVVIGAKRMSVSETAALEPLSSIVAIETLKKDDRNLAKLCRQHACTLANVAVIATHPRDLPYALEAELTVTLKGAGYENEAAADRVFAPRSAGGLVMAIEYIRSLIKATDGNAN